MSVFTHHRAEVNKLSDKCPVDLGTGKCLRRTTGAKSDEIPNISSRTGASHAFNDINDEPTRNSIAGPVGVTKAILKYSDIFP